MRICFVAAPRGKQIEICESLEGKMDNEIQGFIGLADNYIKGRFAWWDF